MESDDQADFETAAEYQGPWVVAVYHVDRAYGGPEEGGWWYGVKEPSHEYAEHMRGFSCLDEARTYRDHIDATVCGPANKNRRGLHSVLSQGLYAVEICEGVPEAYPKRRPYYE